MQVCTISDVSSDQNGCKGVEDKESRSVNSTLSLDRSSSGDYDENEKNNLVTCQSIYKSENNCSSSPVSSIHDVTDEGFQGCGGKRFNKSEEMCCIERVPKDYDDSLYLGKNFFDRYIHEDQRFDSVGLSQNGNHNLHECGTDPLHIPYENNYIRNGDSDNTFIIGRQRPFLNIVGQEQKIYDASLQNFCYSSEDITLSQDRSNFSPRCLIECGSFNDTSNCHETDVYDVEAVPSNHDNKLFSDGKIKVYKKLVPTFLLETNFTGLYNRSRIVPFAIKSISKFASGRFKTECLPKTLDCKPCMAKSSTSKEICSRACGKNNDIGRFTVKPIVDNPEDCTSKMSLIEANKLKSSHVLIVRSAYKTNELGIKWRKQLLRSVIGTSAIGTFLSDLALATANKTLPGDVIDPKLRTILTSIYNGDSDEALNLFVETFIFARDNSLIQQNFGFNEEVLEMNGGTGARESDVFDMSEFNEISKLCVSSFQAENEFHTAGESVVSLLFSRFLCTEKTHDEIVENPSILENELFEYYSLTNLPVIFPMTFTNKNESATSILGGTHVRDGNSWNGVSEWPVLSFQSKTLIFVLSSVRLLCNGQLISISINLTQDTYWMYNGMVDGVGRTYAGGQEDVFTEFIRRKYNVNYTICEAWYRIIVRNDKKTDSLISSSLSSIESGEKNREELSLHNKGNTLFEQHSVTRTNTNFRELLLRRKNLYEFMQKYRSSSSFLTAARTLINVAATVGTWYAQLVGHSNVMASAAITIVCTMCFDRRLGQASFCGSFAGMCSSVLVPDVWWALFLGILTAFNFEVLIQTRNMFLGVGGRLGATAFIATFIVALAQQISTGILSFSFTTFTNAFIVEEVLSMAFWHAVGSVATIVLRETSDESSAADPVRASAVVGLFGALVFEDKSAALGVYGGSFVGMSSPSRLMYGILPGNVEPGVKLPTPSKLKRILAFAGAGCLGGLVHGLSAETGIFAGAWGGKAGLSAFVGCLIYRGLDNVWSSLQKKVVSTEDN